MNIDDILDMSKAYSIPFQKYVRFIDKNQFPNQIMRYLNTEVNPEDIRVIASDMMNMMWGIFVSEMKKTSLVNLKSVDELVGDVRPFLLFYYRWTIPMFKGVLDKSIASKDLTLTPDVEFKEMMWFSHVIDDPHRYSLSGFSSDGSSRIQVHINKPNEEPALADDELALYVLKAWLSDRRICEIENVPSAFEVIRYLDKKGRGEKFFKILEMIRDAVPYDDSLVKAKKKEYLKELKDYPKSKQEDEANRRYYQDVMNRVVRHAESIERIVNDPTASVLLVEDYMLRDFKEYVTLQNGWNSLLSEILYYALISSQFDPDGEFRPFKLGFDTEWYTRLLK